MKKNTVIYCLVSIVIILFFVFLTVTQKNRVTKVEEKRIEKEEDDDFVTKRILEQSLKLPIGTFGF